MVYVISVEPVVHVRESQREAGTEASALTSVVNRLESRLREKRTAAGRPHDIRVCSDTS